MPKKKRGKKAKKARRDIPPWGRSVNDIAGDLGLQDFSADVPLGNTDPTVVQGVMDDQEMPNYSRMARGRLVRQRGKRD